MKTKFNGILTLLLALVVQFTFAQEKTISGIVTDESGPLPGVSVVIKGTQTGTQTDFDGKYTLKATVGDILVFNYVGMNTQEKTVGQPNTINVVLISGNVLEEIVIIGYGTTTKTKSSIASVTISAETIQDRPNASFVQTLSGQVAGLSITTSSGQPGANSTVHLRGITSINGNTEPLFIIDGAPVDQDNFRSLNPNEIASITVLKDAGATAIYGNRGANGVIIIKTKSGSFNSGLKISYTGTLSYATLQDNDYNLMNSQQQLTIERLQGSGRGATLTDAEIAEATTTDWFDFFFKTALTKSHNLTLSSGGENMRSFVSIGFHDQEGVLKSSSLKRFNFRSNINGKSSNDKFNYGLNLSINYSESDEPNSIGSGAINRNYILGAYQSVPYISPDDYTNGADLLSPLSFSNTPLFLMDRLATYTRAEDELKLIGTLTASYKIIDDLTVAVVLSADLQDENLTRAEGPDSFNALLFAETGNDTPGFQNQQFSRQFSFNQVTSLNYNKEFGVHTVNVGLFVEYFKAHWQTFGFFQEGLNAATFFPGDGSAFVADNADNDFFADTANANILEAGLFSYFSQVDYDYDTKYGITGTVRRDASYRFSQSNRWATFYSVAARWNMHKEAFMENSVFDFLKIRGSYGTSGNQNISGVGLFASPDLTLDLFATGSGYAGANALFLAQIGNSTLRWETVTSANIGIDFEVFNRRLSGSVDGYIKTTTDLFQSTPVSAINAVNFLSANVGELENTGIDLELRYDILKSTEEDGLNIRLNFVGNYNKTELTDLPGDDEELIGTGRVGGKLFEYYRYRYAGVNPANGNLLFYTADGEVTENPNVDTDRVWLDKNIFPDYQGSFGINADYKGFFLTTQFNYVVGVDRLDFDLSGFQSPDNIGQFRSSTDLLRAWTPDNRITDIPALGAANRALGGASTRYLKSADYLRLRFAQFGYVVPSKFLEGTGFSVVKIFASAENLITWSKWRGFDVEAQSNTSRLYPSPKTVSFGIEVGF